MKKEIRWGVAPLISTVVIILASGYLICLPAGKQRQRESEEMGLSLKGDRGRETVIGDPGLSDEELKSPVRDKNERTRRNLIKLALEGVGNVPFLEGGRFLEGQFSEFPDGMDNRYLEKEFQTGVDSLGYVQWLYYQLFQEVIEDPAEDFRQGNRIDLSELRTGDIAMREYQNGAANHYGIFLGYDEGNPVVVHCDSGPQPHFPEGVLKLSTIGVNGKYYMGTPSEEFSYFTRPAVTWDDEYFIGDITDLLSVYHTEETEILNQCGDYGRMLLHKIKEENYSWMLEGLNVEILRKKGYSLNREEYIKKLETLSLIYANKKIMVYNVSKLPDSGAFVARFCLTEETEGAKEEIINDTLYCQWQDITLYLNNAGEITSYLPHHEAMPAHASEYGITKE